jgi:hypothetical protein
MTNADKLILSSYIVKRAVAEPVSTRAASFKYRPFNANDSLYGGLAAAALGGLGGAAYGKLKDYMEPEEEELDPRSDDYGFKMLERMQGKSRKKPSSVGASALTGALALGLPVGLAPLLVGDNPIGRGLVSGSYNKGIDSQKDMPEMVKNILREIIKVAPHSLKKLPFENVAINF